jgi:excisionase family DNA binding protein
MQSKPLLTTPEAAAYLCVSRAFLERDRWAGPTIPFVKVGSRAVRYRIDDLDEFITARRMRASAQAQRAADAQGSASDSQS